MVLGFFHELTLIQTGEIKMSMNTYQRNTPKYLGGTSAEGRSFKEYIKDVMKKIRNYFKWK